MVAIGQCQALAVTQVGDHGPSQNHRLGHQIARWAWLRDLELGDAAIDPNTTFQLIHYQGPLALPPTPAQVEQRVEPEEVSLLGWGQLKQLIGIAIGQPIGGLHPTALHP